MTPSLEFYSNGNNFLVNGITSQTLVYENQQMQETRAKENVTRINSITDSNIILMGAEHFLFIDTLLKTGNQIIIIEKNPLKMAFYQKQVGVVSGEFICISGSFGLFTPFNTTGPGLIADEANDILMRLSKSSIDWSKNTEFFTVYTQPNQEPLDKTLHENIGFVLDAKKFHLSQESEYNRYKQLNLTPQKTGKLVYDEFDADFLKRFKIPHHDNRDVLVLKGIIENKPVAKDDLGYLNKQSVFFAKKTKIILDWIFSQKLTTIAFKNLSVFVELGDLLFFGEMFEKINIDILPCFTDWFQQQSRVSSTGGKYFFPFFNNLKKPIRVGTIYPHEGVCFKPPQTLLYNVPFSFLDPDIDFLQPLVDPDSTTLDIAVIHHARLSYIEFKEVNELFEAAIDLGTHHNEKDSFDILHILQQENIRESYPLNSYTAKNTLQGMDFLFYAQTRTRWVLRLLENLGDKYSIKIHDKDWAGLIPQKYVGPGTQNKKELQKIYRESFLTLDFSPAYSSYIHSLNMIDAFVSGGLCLSLAPLYFDFENERLFKRDSLFYFGSMHELQGKIEYLFNNKDKRAGIIRETQQLFHDKGLDSFYPNKMERLNDSLTLPVSDQNPVLIDIAKGYLLLLLGIPLQAFIKFQNNLMALDYSYVPLIIRTVKTGFLCGEREKSLKILKRGIEKHPTNEPLLNYFNSIKGELLK